jgi:hypothetical protein
MGLLCSRLIMTETATRSGKGYTRVMVDLTPGWLERAVRAGVATQRQPTPPSETTTRERDDAQMRKKAKAAVERASTQSRYARAAQERADALTKRKRR